MKRLIASTLLVLIGSVAFAPVASANRQLSTPDQLSEGASLQDLIQHNRDVRSKK